MNEEKQNKLKGHVFICYFNTNEDLCSRRGKFHSILYIFGM